MIFSRSFIRDPMMWSLSTVQILRSKREWGVNIFVTVSYITYLDTNRSPIPLAIY
jgi:hypothetical protein